MQKILNLFRRSNFGPGTERVVGITPGGETAQEGADAGKTAFAQPQSGFGAGNFIGAVAVGNDFPVAGEFVLAFLKFVKVEVQGAEDDDGIFLEFHDRAEVEDARFRIGIEELTELRHGDFSHAEFAKETLTVPEFKCDVEGEQNEDNAQGTPTEVFKNGDNPGDLVAEEGAQQEKDAAVKERAKTVEEEEAPTAEPTQTGQWWSNGAHAGDELGNEDAAPAITVKDIGGAAYAGIRFQRKTAEESENLGTAKFAKVKPGKIGDEARDRSQYQPGDGVEMASGSQRPGR